MHRISSNYTIFFTMFLPTIWFTFFATFSVALLISDPYDLPGILGVASFRYIFLLSFLLFLVFIYFTLMRLRRVELADNGIIISNYFKTYRYSYDDLISIKITNFGLFHLGILRMAAKTKMGKNIPFIMKRSYFEDFAIEHPHLFEGKIIEN